MHTEGIGTQRHTEAHRGTQRGYAHGGTERPGMGAQGIGSHMHRHRHTRAWGTGRQGHGAHGGARLLKDNREIKWGLLY